MHGGPSAVADPRGQLEAYLRLSRVGPDPAPLPVVQLPDAALRALFAPEALRELGLSRQL